MLDLVTDEAVGKDGAAAASFSVDRSHRYLLTRCWDPSGDLLNFLMLNPSTADAFRLDPTIVRCVKRAQQLGYGGLIVTNLFAFRATSPADMRRAPDPVGARNDEAIRLGVRNSRATVCGWGNHGAFMDRQTAVREMLDGSSCPAERMWRIGPANKSGSPKHPLYCSFETALERHL